MRCNECMRDVEVCASCGRPFALGQNMLEDDSLHHFCSPDCATNDMMTTEVIQ